MHIAIERTEFDLQVFVYIHYMPDLHTSFSVKNRHLISATNAIFKIHDMIQKPCKLLPPSCKNTAVRTSTVADSGV